MLSPKQIMEKLNQYQVRLDPFWKRWLIRRGRSFYLSTGYVRLEHQGTGILLHRLIMNAKKGQDVDHINGIRTDNRRINLRIATRAQNIANGRLAKNNISDVRGVYFESSKNRWRAQIECKRVRYRQIFNNKEEAVAWRLQKEVELWGEHAPSALDIF